MSNWDDQAREFYSLTRGPTRPDTQRAIRLLVGKTASTLPTDSPNALSWFVSALEDDSKKWFVAKVMSMTSPVPRTMLDPMVLAGLREGNPSANRNFLEPCIRSFGKRIVEERIHALANSPGVAENDGVHNALYWLDAAPNAQFDSIAPRRST